MMTYMQQLIRRITADKKKLSIMVGLLAVLMLLWGRLLLKEVPRTAVADPVMTTQVANNRGAARSSQIDSLARLEVELPGNLGRDLFALDVTAYTPVQKKPIVEVSVEKSPREISDEQLKASQVRQAATGLKLQTTMHGAQPLALINGELIQVGQTIRGFELIQVLPRQVVLRMNGIDIHLEM